MNTATFDASPYSHVVYSFASIDSSYRLEAWDGTYGVEVPLYREFNTVKQRHPGIKTMIAVGGWSHNDPGPMQKRFSEMAGSKTNRQTFAKSVVQFLRTYGFDGLDLGEFLFLMLNLFSPLYMIQTSDTSFILASSINTRLGISWSQRSRWKAC